MAAIHRVELELDPGQVIAELHSFAGIGILVNLFVHADGTQSIPPV